MENSVPVLHELSTTDASRLKSGARFISVFKAMMELLSNSIEADSNEIHTTVNWTKHSFSINDNGFGIRRDDFHKIGTVNCSGKQSFYKEWMFRGQSLKCIGQLGRLRITSRPRGEYESWTKLIADGTVMQSSLQLPPREEHGTSISVERFLAKFPVRQKRSLHLKTSRAVLDLRDGILRRLLPFPQIQLTLVNEENGVVVLSLSKGRSRSCMMKHLFGDFVHSMVAIEQSDNGTRLQGSILIPGGMKNPSSNLQYLYLNNRVVECLVLQQMIESMYSNAFQLVHEHSSQQPVKFVYLLQLETTTDKFEIILEQDKTIVEFKDSDGVFKFIKRALVEAWSTHLPHSVMNKLISRSFTKESNVNPVGNENSMKRKVSSLFSPIISSRNRSLISVQASYAEVEDDENLPLVASLNQSTQNSSSIESTTDMSTPIKTTQSPTEIDSLTDKEIAESEDSEIQWVSAPPFYKKIKRSVHFNPPISLSTTSHTSCNLESSSNVQGPIQDVNPHPVIPATRHRSYPKRTQNWTNTDFGAKLKNSADCSVKSMDSMTTGETVRVIGCFDNKFILIQKGTRIIAVDQHAADERVILEHIERQIIEELSTGFAHPVEQPIETRIAPLEQEIFTNYSQHLAQWGWKGEFTNTGFLRVTHQPRILGVSLNLIDLKIHLHELDNSHGVDSIPTPVHKVLRSKACRRAIKFGDMLSVNQQSRLLEDLFATEFWFICAHGRPTTCTIISEI